LTPEVVERIGRALAEWLPTEGAVAVGWDMRPDSLDFSKAVIKGLTEQGRDVISIGLVPSDVYYFAAGSLGLAGALMITASHNPGEYNGIKIVQRNAKAVSIESGLAEIRDLATKNEWPKRTTGTVTEKNINEAWLEHVLSFVDVKTWPNYHIAIDAGNGMYGALGSQLEARLPVKVEQMYYELDGTFPNHGADPAKKENLQDLSKKIIDEKLDFGIAFDGDGDRAILVDETGAPVSGTIMNAIIASYELKKHPGGTILYAAVVGKIVPETAEKLGGKAIRTRVGHSFVQEGMIKHDAVFGGETSGHLFFKDNYGADSGMIGAVVVIQALVDSGKKLSELVKDYDKYVYLDQVSLPTDNKEALLEKIKGAFAGEDIDELDGVTVNFPYGWFNLRPSNTEPILRLTAEATDQTHLDELYARVKAVIAD
jgi:phosphomannomutase